MSPRAFRRRVERAACAVTDVPAAELWSRRITERHLIARGLAVYVLVKAGGVSAREIAAAVGMGQEAIDEARSRIAVLSVSSPAVRRALWDVAARVGVDSAILLPETVQGVPMASARRERVPA